MLKFQTISLVAGTRICNASCPFCVSKMTGMRQVGKQAEPINERNLLKAIQLCKSGGVTSVLITGKGEPTLYPEHIHEYLRFAGYQFPFIELQTNGSMMDSNQLRRWADAGLTTVMISNCGINPGFNREIYFPKGKWIDLPRVVDMCHEAGLIIRYTTVGVRDGVDSIYELAKLMDYTKKLGIEQVSWRPVAKPDSTADAAATKWVYENGIAFKDVYEIVEHVAEAGTLLYSLVHGAAVYDYNGQNLCLTNCLTKDAEHPNEETLRQLIFFPDGSLYTDWQLKGSRLL